MPIDFKKTQKELYNPKTTPCIIDLPQMTFIMVDGQGDPNTSEQYKYALEILYGLSYAIKMSKMSGNQPDGYYEYVVPPLEGLWWSSNSDGSFDMSDKDSFCWTSMIRQPEFVTGQVLDMAKTLFAKKKPELDLSSARLGNLAEGLCVQVMHIGSYDNEAATVEAMEQYAADNGYAVDISDTRRHHEIYLSDPRKTAPEKLKTVIRIPVRGIDK